MTTIAALTAVHAAPLADPERPMPATVLADPDRAGCAWWVVDTAATSTGAHGAHPHAA